ncbi:MAG: ribulose 1,5-bisphosphate carboxylase [Deltaproteobacteria bacterium]|nr:ribulose 1,5-bisphosphate carboxylase [Deltaproteobacteria bacterium]
MIGDYESEPRALPEGIDMENHVIATYYSAWPADWNLDQMAPILSIEQSTGTFEPMPGETPELRRNHLAKVIGVYEAPYYEHSIEPEITERQYIIQIAFPAVNIENQLPMLMTTCVGNISLAKKLKLLELRIPKVILDGYQGPKFGIEGVYELLNVELGSRPLLNNMIKPCTGYSVEVGAELFYQAALGGADVIKDDELIADMAFNHAVDRVTAYMEKERKVFEETGEHTLYAVNVTGRLPHMLETAKRVIEAGGNCLMVNYIAVGPEAMRALAEDPDINVPILAHQDVAGAYFMSPFNGVSSPIMMGKIPRLAGADIIAFPFALGGKATYLHERYSTVARCLTYPFGALKPTMPMPGGGLTPANVPEAVREHGINFIIGAGGGIHGHPQGPVAGARAFRQAIDAVMKGIPVEEYASDHEELSVALGKWPKFTIFKTE